LSKSGYYDGMQNWTNKHVAAGVLVSADQLMYMFVDTNRC
jgi:hypothetical protein